MKTLDQALFDAIGKTITGLGYRWYPSLPDQNASYPFVAMGEIQVKRLQTYYKLLGKAYVTINVWGSYKQRRKVAEMIESIELAILRLEVNKRMLVQNRKYTDSRILADNVSDNRVGGSSSTTMWHGLLFLEFYIN